MFRTFGLEVEWLEERQGQRVVVEEELKDP